MVKQMSRNESLSQTMILKLLTGILVRRNSIEDEFHSCQNRAFSAIDFPSICLFIFRKTN